MVNGPLVIWPMTGVDMMLEVRLHRNNYTKDSTPLLVKSCYMEDKTFTMYWKAGPIEGIREDNKILIGYSLSFTPEYHSLPDCVQTNVDMDTKIEDKLEDLSDKLVSKILEKVLDKLGKL